MIGGLVLAAVLLVCYGVARAKASQWPEVGHVVLLTATTTGITAGVRLVVVAITASSIAPFRSDDRLFIPLAGVALVLVSAREFWKVIAGAIAAPDEPTG